GHTGYTGTSVWCDTDRKIYIIFLTNRVYPSRGNEGIKEIRPDLHNAIITLITNN
ncbi:MAG: serine hydrolase, partial [Ignavibacteriae bacterium]|nr:serine hydrolase [Ignavibacteriota bacterium]